MMHQLTLSVEVCTVCDRDGVEASGYASGTPRFRELGIGPCHVGRDGLVPLRAQLGNGYEGHVCVERAMDELLALRAKKRAIAKDSPPNVRRDAIAVASSNPVRDITENVDDLVY
jgi:hypothetical protein